MSLWRRPDPVPDVRMRRERLRHDIAAYRREPPTTTETQIADLASTAGLEDDTDWEALYPEA